MKRLKRDNETLDRLSGLSDSLILKILSFLEMKDVVRTTLVSKRWKDLWTITPCFDFNESNMNLVQTRNFIIGFCSVGKMLGVMKGKYSFLNVKTLKCRGGPIEPYDIVGIVEYFPNVEKLLVDSFRDASTHLFIADLSQKHDFGEKCLESEEANNQLKSFLMQLKTVEVSWYSYKTASMFQIIELLSKHATMLQKIVIKKEGNGVVKSKVMILAAQQLLSLQRSFPTIDLIVCQK